jgi:hypothetical protein
MRRLVLVTLIMLMLMPTPASAELFRADSKQLGITEMDIVVREVARRARSSVLAVDVAARGSSVGGSIFILCSIRQLAQERGGARYVVKVDDQPQRGQMLVGFMARPAEDPRDIDPAFPRLGPDAVIDLDRFRPFCPGPK